ncbi:MAG TPA: nucleotidyltransferase family protein, partial [Firmicutes bacterium]|nr:nucleotidyltransferase family protein [Bacillota bacterium]
IIAEYDPFHNGHAYLIDCLRQQHGATHLVAVMSGHVTQRGSLSCFDKWTRTQAALMGGIDLVLELPAPFACASAEYFARSGIQILQKLGCVSLLGFGSESGNLTALKDLAKACWEVEKNGMVAAKLEAGMSYPRARMEAVAGLTGVEASLLSHPNDLLAVEYLKALRTTDSPAGSIQPVAVPRKGVSHDAPVPDGGFASASFLRRICNDPVFCNTLQDFVPPAAFSLYQEALKMQHAPAALENLEQAVLYRLRFASPQDFSVLPDVTEGLEHRLFRAAAVCNSIAEFLQLAKTKRYTHSRLRRILFCLLAGITKEDTALDPYIRVLGMNVKGREILAAARKTASCRPSPLFKQLAAVHPRLAEIECHVSALRSLSLGKSECLAEEFQKSPVLLNENNENVEI